MMKVFKLLLLAGLLASRAIAADAPKEEQTWELTSYLKGTTSQVAETLNGDLERLLRVRREARVQIAESGEKQKAAEAQALEQVHAHPRDIELRKAMEEADKRRTESRKADSPDRLDAAGKFIKRKQELDAFEHDMLGTDQSLLAAKKSADEARQRLQRAESSIPRAYEWRERVVDAIKNTFALGWPLDPGRIGILGSVTPQHIDRERGAITFSYNAREELDRAGEQEEIVTVNYRLHDVMMVTTGVDTGGMKIGVPTKLDRNFVIVRADVNQDREVYVVQQKPGGIDELLQAIGQIREQISPAEISAMTAGSKSMPRKPKAKLWTSVPAILAAAPKGDLGVVNDWLGSNIVGDKLDTAVTVDEIFNRPDGGVEVRGRAEPAQGKSHVIVNSYRAAAAERAKSFKISQKVRFAGVIQDIRAQKADELFIELNSESP